MAKRKTLDVSALRAVADPQPNPVEKLERAKVETRPKPKPKPAERAPTKAITGHFPPEVRQELRALAAAQDAKLQDLLAEALNDLFVKHGRPPGSAR